MYANRQIEQMDRAAMASLQLERLKKQVRWAQEKSFFYNQKFEAKGVSYRDIQSLEDIRKLPFLKPRELFRLDSLDILTMPISSILRFNVISLEQGEVKNLYTNGDVAHNVEMMTRCLVAEGIHSASVVALQGDLSDSRLLDIQYALEMIGATVVPMGTDYRQWLRLMELISCDTDQYTTAHYAADYPAAGYRLQYRRLPVVQGYLPEFSGDAECYAASHC